MLTLRCEVHDGQIKLLHYLVNKLDKAMIASEKSITERYGKGGSKSVRGGFEGGKVGTEAQGADRKSQATDHEG